MCGLFGGEGWENAFGGFVTVWMAKKRMDVWLQGGNEKQREQSTPLQHCDPLEAVQLFKGDITGQNWLSLGLVLEGKVKQPGEFLSCSQHGHMPNLGRAEDTLRGFPCSIGYNPPAALI